MAASIAEFTGRFGFRTDQGRIDARTWWQGTRISGRAACRSHPDLVSPRALRAP